MYAERSFPSLCILLTDPTVSAIKPPPANHSCKWSAKWPHLCEFCVCVCMITFPFASLVVQGNADARDTFLVPKLRVLVFIITSCVCKKLFRCVVFGLYIAWSWIVHRLQQGWSACTYMTTTSSWCCETGSASCTLVSKATNPCLLHYSSWKPPKVENQQLLWF